MARVAFTLRIDAEERAALENLSKVERRPVNQLLNEAVRDFLLRRRRKWRSPEANLERLRAYRERDPQFRRARKAFVEAEASVDEDKEHRETVRIPQR
jgi:predicted transcriptional regulator